MHHSLPLFGTITMAILTAFVGGYVARRLRLPALIGYLLAGVVIGPFTPGFVGDSYAAGQLAEMGVVFMMFGVGLHFSFKDLWRVRHIALPGAALQMLLATLCGLGISQLWGWSVSAGLVLGLAISIASTVVLLRGLSDNGLLNTPEGKVAIGWLVLEDLATVAILVLLPAIVTDAENPAASIGLALLKTGTFVGLMLFIGARVMPWLLTQIAGTRSKELFILAVVALALGTAFAAYELFGVSLALGAFLAGVVLGESDISHQVGDEVTPFRDIFAVLFFVSVGMLVNPAILVSHAGQILALTVLVVVGKAVITVLLGLVVPAQGRTLATVAAGLGQIGEFSFIVGQAGVSLNLLTQDQYGLILASALLSIVLNPWAFKLIPQLEQLLQNIPMIRRRSAPATTPNGPALSDHVVVVGMGRVGSHIMGILSHLGLKYIVIEQDELRAAEVQATGVPVLLGDAANSEILTLSGLDRARTLVVTISNETAVEVVVTAARLLAPKVPIIARAGTASGVHRLAAIGAQAVVYPELEGGLEVVRHTLLVLGYPVQKIQAYVDAARRDTYTGTLPGEASFPVLDQLLTVVRGIEIAWQPVTEGSMVNGKSIAETNMRSSIGASIVAIVRDSEVIPNPKPDLRFALGDLVGFIGAPEELRAADQLISARVQT